MRENGSLTSKKNVHVFAFGMSAAGHTRLNLARAKRVCLALEFEPIVIETGASISGLWRSEYFVAR